MVTQTPRIRERARVEIESREIEMERCENARVCEMGKVHSLSSRYIKKVVVVKNVEKKKVWWL
jgi:hypothetical protein